MRFANYRGDVTSIVDEIKGPDGQSRFWRATAADYDPAVDRTRVEFEQVRPPAEIAAAIEQAAAGRFPHELAAVLDQRTEVLR